MSRAKKKKRIYHISNWPVHLVIGILRLIALLPRCCKRKLAAFLGWAFFHHAKKMRHIATVNIQTCFPHLSAAEQEAMVKQNLALLGLMFMEIINMFWPSRTSIAPVLGNITGTEHIQAALAKGQGVILLFPHLIAIYIVGYLLGQKRLFKFSAMFNRPRNAALGAFMNKHITKHCEKLFTRKDAAAMIAHIKQGNIVWYAPDLEPHRKHAIFAPFFGQQAATYNTTGRIAKATNAAVIAIAFYRRENEAVYDVIFHPPLTNFPTDDDVTDATQVNKKVEEIIQVKPEQYLWIYKRFSYLKDKPKGLYQSNNQNTQPADNNETRRRM